MTNWKRVVCPLLCVMLIWACSDNSGQQSDGGENFGDSASASNADTGLGTSESGSDAGSGVPSATGARHNFCNDIGDNFAMGAAIYGDPGTNWYLSLAEAPASVNWFTGYMYTSGDPAPDPSGFEWIVNFRMDTAIEGGATLPMVTFYRMLNVGQDFGYTGSEAEIVQQMLQDGDAVRKYLDDFIAVLGILHARPTPTIVHVEPDSWGFMMWVFDGAPGSDGAGDAEGIPVAMSAAAHNALNGQSFPDTAGGLGRAMLYLRDNYAPELRMGWHASNFRVGTRPEVVTSFYSTMGPWDLIVTEPPHMVNNGNGAWDMSETDNQANQNWFNTVSTRTGLPIIIWQTYVQEADPYLGNWPTVQNNIEMFAQNGVVAILWDPNSEGCGYSCDGADDLETYLGNYADASLALPAGSICQRIE